MRTHAGSAPNTPFSPRHRIPGGQSRLDPSLTQNPPRPFREITLDSLKSQMDRGLSVGSNSVVSPKNHSTPGIRRGYIHQVPHKPTVVVPSQSIHRKPVGSPQYRREVSTETVVHNTGVAESLPQKRADSIRQPQPTTPIRAPRSEVVAPGDNITHIPKPSSPTMLVNPFLDVLQGPTNSRSLQENFAIATPYPSAPGSQIQSARPSVQNFKGISSGMRFAAIKELTPMALRDPGAARIPPRLGSRAPPIPEVRHQHGDPRG